MATESALEVRQLTKFYGPVAGIRQVSFSICRGEIFGFLGPNGAGKTTTIRLLLDLLRPTSGKIFYYGREAVRNSPFFRSKCGYLPGTFSAYGNMTGTEFLDFVAGMRGENERVRVELIRRFNLSTRDLSRRIRRLSHGTIQKIGLIQALSHDPDFIILDEPTNGLDPLMQDVLYQILLELKEQGKTVIFSSHNLSEVEKICQRVCILREGELVVLETVEALKKKRYRRMILMFEHEDCDFVIPGADLVARRGMRCEYIIHGSMKEVIAALASMPVSDITLPEPDLNEVFMTYYRSGNHD